MKNNQEAVERFDQAHGAKINRLFWIAGSLKSRDLKDLLNDDMGESDFEKCFPEVFNSEYFNDYKDNNELLQALVDFRKFGLLAEILIPEADCFRYENDRPVSWSIHQGICRIEYVYEESLAKLMLKIEKSAAIVFREYIDADKKKTQTKQNEKKATVPEYR